MNEHRPQGIRKKKLKHAQNEKRKTYHGFFVIHEIGQILKRFSRTLSLGANLFFLKSE